MNSETHQLAIPVATHESQHVRENGRAWLQSKIDAFISGANGAEDPARVAHVKEVVCVEDHHNVAQHLETLSHEQWRDVAQKMFEQPHDLKRDVSWMDVLDASVKHRDLHQSLQRFEVVPENMRGKIEDHFLIKPEVQEAAQVVTNTASEFSVDQEALLRLDDKGFRAKLAQLAEQRKGLGVEAKAAAWQQVSDLLDARAQQTIEQHVQAVNLPTVKVQAATTQVESKGLAQSLRSPEVDTAIGKGEEVASRSGRMLGWGAAGVGVAIAGMWAAKALRAKEEKAASSGVDAHSIHR